MFRIIILASILCFPFLSQAQQGFTISGKLKELNDQAKIYLAIPLDGRYQDIDSVEVKNGTFEFKGHVESITPALLNLKRLNSSSKGQDHLTFFLENSNMKVVGVDSINSATLTGSKSDEEERLLESMISPITKSIIQIQNDFAKMEKPTSQDTLIARDSLMYLIQKIKDVRQDFVAQRLDSEFAMYTFNMGVLDTKFEPANVEPLFHQFSDRLKNSELGKKSLEVIENAKRKEAGAAATDFTQQDLNDKPFQLSSLRGKYVLVDFWASWCVPCRAENPHLVKAYEKLKGDNFEIVGVSLDQSKESWETAIKQDNLPWVHVSDLKGWKNDVAIMYDVRSVPQNFLINPEGIIIATNLRGDNLTEQLAKLIK